MNGKLAATLAIVACPSLLMLGAVLRDPATAWLAGLGSHPGAIATPTPAPSMAESVPEDREPVPVDGFVVEPLPPRLAATAGQVTTLLPRRITGGTGPFTRRLSGGAGASLTYSGAVMVSPAVPGRAGPFTLTVTDAQGRTSSSQMYVEASAPLALVGTPPDHATVGVPYSARFQTRGGRGPYAWSFSGVEPDGLSFSNGTLSGTPVRTGASDGMVVTVTDADNRQAYSGSFGVEVSMPIDLQALPPTLVASVGEPVAVPPRAVSGGTAPYAWSFNGSDGVGMGQDGGLRVAATRSGKLGPFTLSVRDARGRSSSTTMWVSSAEPLRVSATADASIAQGMDARLAPPTVSGGLQPYSYALLDRFGKVAFPPPGMSFSSATGVMEGNPQVAAATAGLAVRVTDASGRSAEGSRFALSVVAATDGTTATPREVFVDGAYACTSRRSSDCHRNGNLDGFEIRFQGLVRVNDLSFGCSYGTVPTGYWETYDGARWSRPTPTYSLPCSVVIPVTAVSAVRFTRTDGRYERTWSPTAQLNAYVQ